MQSLCQSTHLYGRRLVLEWAQSAEDDLEQMRKRTAERFPRGIYERKNGYSFSFNFRSLKAHLLFIKVP